MSGNIEVDGLINVLSKSKFYGETFDNYPAIDAETVAHGHWIQEGEPPMCSWTCSACGQKFSNRYLQPHGEHCSICGAKMDEKIK